jgi:hypothetical protein
MADFTSVFYQSALVGVATWLLYVVLRTAWNLSPYHPLAHIPGPRLAAATYLPEFFHDTVKFGRYTRQITRMHEKYGTLPLSGALENRDGIVC